MNEILKKFQKAKAQITCRIEGYWVWGSSVIRGDDGVYHLFGARVPKSDRFSFHPGWLFSGDIFRAESQSPEGPFQFKEVVLPRRGAQYWDGRSTHNPKIVRIGQKYVLYYMGSTHPFEEPAEGNGEMADTKSKWCIAGRANKRVGIAVSDSPYGPWERFDEPILKTKPNSYYSFLTSNPSPLVMEDGTVFLMFKSRQYEGNQHGPMMIGMAKAKSYEGPYEVISTGPLFSKDKFGVIEDPYIWYENEMFHLLAKDQNGTITGQEKGVGVLGHSKDGLDWSLDEEPLAYTKNIELAGEAQKSVGHLERVSALHDKSGKITHLYFATWVGSSSFGDPKADSNSFGICVPLE